MPFIIIITIAIYIILITWSWKSLGNIERTKKIITIAIGIIAIYLITCFVFNVSKQGIVYENEQIASSIGKVIISIFAGVNGLIIMPFIGKLLDKVNEDEIEKQVFSRKILIIVVIFLIILWLECGYMKDTQEGILKIYHSMK